MTSIYKYEIEGEKIIDNLLQNTQQFNQANDNLAQTKAMVDLTATNLLKIRTDIDVAEKQVAHTTSAYSDAIQQTHQLEHVSEESLSQNQHTLELEKAKHKQALTKVTELKSLEQQIFQELLQYEKAYDRALHKVETLKCKTEQGKEKQIENIDFLLNFLSQSASYDLPFEDRPAVELPKTAKSMGHITWEFSDKIKYNGEKND